ncbi:MAG: uncharacterized protein QOE37_1113 [Microbacteriaceae bacterium]|jgi:ketosteroid isomerase-like protein|nr:uncharacterized protein [Microbacteriaceae bacterium]MDT7745642.1 uncharacterized protein [Actinomycetota bacterium]
MSSTDTDPATTMSVNAAAVAEIYAAFGRGDVAAILERLADDVAWDTWPRNYAQETGVDHLSARRGPSEVAEFFTVIADWTVLAFDVQDIIGTGDQVVAQIHAEFDLPGGGRLHDEELHLWTFDDHGRVRAFRHYTDTAKHIAAQAGADTTPHKR